MLEVKMIWSDDKNDIEIRKFEPDVEAEDLALVNNADSPYESIMPIDVFTKMLQAVGYHPQTIGRYLVSYGIDYLYDNNSFEEADKVIRDIMKEIE